MRNMTRCAGLLMALWLVACANPQLECLDSFGCLALRPGEPVVLVALLDESEATAALVTDLRRGIELAVADREQELLGHPIEVAVRDAGCLAETGAAAAAQVAAEAGVVGVIGTLCSESAAAAVPVLADAGQVMISPANTAPGLTQTAATPGGVPAYFRTAPNYLQHAALMATYAATELGAGTAVVLHDPGAPLADLAAAFEQSFTRQGGRVELVQPVTPGQPVSEELLLAAADHEPDVLYLPLFEPEAISLVSRYREFPALADAVLMGPDSLWRESFAIGAGPAVNGMLLSGLSAAGSAYDAFRQRWTDRYPATPASALAATAYDAAALLLDSAAAVAQAGGDGSLLLGRQALRQAVADTRAYAGVSGRLSCDPGGECAAADLLAVFRLGDMELPTSAWPPPVVWRPEA